MGEKIIKAKDFMTKYVFSIPPDVTVYELNYYVDIDAISGNILEIAHDVY